MNFNRIRNKLRVHGRKGGKGISCRYVPLEFSFAGRIDDTKSTKHEIRRDDNGAFAERRYTVDESHVHARVYNILKARRGVARGGEGGCKVLSSFASRQILPLSRSKMAGAEKKGERGTREKGERERK